jgi:DNA-binding GntR family transcriptional regulator
MALKKTQSADQPSQQKKTRRSGAGRRQTPAPRLSLSEPGEYLSLELQVYGAVRLALMSGDITPGQMLTSRSISSSLAISPTPVREALKRLEAEGVLKARNKSAYHVSELDSTDFTEIFDVRIILESQAVATAAQNIQEENLVLIEKLNLEYERLTSKNDCPVNEVLAANFMFHFEIYRLANSKTLVGLIEALWLRIGPTLYEHVIGIDTSKTDWNYHRLIIDALRARDSEAAVAALKADLTTAFNEIVSRLKTRKA